MGFWPEGLVTPDQVRGDSATRPEAIRGRGWPTLEASRGRVLFAPDERDADLDGHPALRGAMFASVPVDHPAASWFKVNEPEEYFDRIRQLVRDGFLVRTHADADAMQVRRDRTPASVAMFVSSDFPEPDLRFSTCRVRLPGGAVARVNPVSGLGVEGSVDATPDATRRRINKSVMHRHDGGEAVASTLVKEGILRKSSAVEQAGPRLLLHWGRRVVRQADRTAGRKAVGMGISARTIKHNSTSMAPARPARGRLLG